MLQLLIAVMIAVTIAVIVKMKHVQILKDSIKINKNSNIILVRAVNCFGFPHFVHVMEYVYFFTDILLHYKGSDKHVVVEIPNIPYESEYVNYFLDKLNQVIPFEFISKCKNKEVNSIMEFNHPGEVRLWLPFIMNDILVHGGSYQQWFQYKNTYKLMRDIFVQPNISQVNMTIGMVNRLPESGRFLVNADEICRTIEEEFGIKVSQTVFEHKPVAEQMQFFRNHQIMIGPHGAHLANIPFLPDDALILECCDEWQPYEYFSGLAYTCDKYHVIFRPSHAAFPNSQQTNTKKNIHCDVAKIVETIRTYISYGNHLPYKFAYLS